MFQKVDRDMTQRHIHTSSGYLRTVVWGLIMAVACILPGQALALSIAEEEAMGRQFLMEIRKNYELVDDGFINGYLNQLGGYLAEPIETKPFPLRFYVIKDSNLNAFAAPGGHIFFFSGLIQTMDHVDELAGVICHEMGHITARHLSQRIEQSKKVGLATLAGILAGVLVGGEAAGALAAGSMAAGQAAQLHYSRENERQADQLGFAYMKEATYNPGGLIRVLKNIDRGTFGAGREVPPYLLTHPTGPERMANLDSMMNSYDAVPLKKEALRFRDAYPFFQAAVRAKCSDPKNAERVFLSDLAKDPHFAPAHFGLGIVYRESSRFGRAIEHLEKARAGAPQFQPILTNLAVAYQMNGQDRHAIDLLREAQKLDGGDPDTLFALGVAYQRMEAYEEALPFLERLVSMPPVQSEVYHHLGICYGRLGRLGKAHYNFGMYFKRMGQPDQAKFHFGKATQQAGNDPALQRKIQEESKGLL
jgi:predicted Zn-dependent protease